MRSRKRTSSSTKCSACAARKSSLIKRERDEGIVSGVCRALGNVLSLIKLGIVLKSLFDSLD